VRRRCGLFVKLLLPPFVHRLNLKTFSDSKTDMLQFYTFSLFLCNSWEVYSSSKTVMFMDHRVHSNRRDCLCIASWSRLVLASLLSAAWVTTRRNGVIHTWTTWCCCCCCCWCGRQWRIYDVSVTYRICDGLSSVDTGCRRISRVTWSIQCLLLIRPRSDRVTVKCAERHRLLRID